MAYKIDWSTFIAIVSLLISAITLYMAHLRGPIIELAVPDKVYPCHELRETERNIWMLTAISFYLTSTSIVTTALRKRSPFAFTASAQM